MINVNVKKLSGGVELPLKQNKCIVCETDSPYILCEECYCQMTEFKKSFDVNLISNEVYEYYNNLKSNINRMKNFDYVKINCNKLIALSYFYKENFKSTLLLDKVHGDVTELISLKKNNETEEDIESECKDKKEYLSVDGHRLASMEERIIDDILYSLRIVHCYNCYVYQIPNQEPQIKADWFIPVVSDNQGIYIEYWGMNTKKYLKNKERKLKQYAKHNIPLIQIELDEYKEIGLRLRIIQELNKLAFEHYNIKQFANKK